MEGLPREIQVHQDLDELSIQVLELRSEAAPGLLRSSEFADLSFQGVDGALKRGRRLAGRPRR